MQCLKSFRIFLDTDVLINWLAKEIDIKTGFDLWPCPYEIIELIEKREIVGHTSLTPEELLERYFPNIFGRIKDNLGITKER